MVTSPLRFGADALFGRSVFRVCQRKIHFNVVPFPIAVHQMYPPTGSRCREQSAAQTRAFVLFLRVKNGIENAVPEIGLVFRSRNRHDKTALISWRQRGGSHRLLFRRSRAKRVLICSFPPCGMASRALRQGNMMTCSILPGSTWNCPLPDADPRDEISSPTCGEHVLVAAHDGVEYHQQHRKNQLASKLHQLACKSSARGRRLL
jgi:hypothetical protein